MEARESLRGAGPSKMLIAVIAIGTTLALGVIGGVVVKNISGATTTSNPSHIVQAQSGRAMVYPKHSGLQTLDDTAAPAVVAGQSAKAAGGADDTFAPALVGGRSATGRGDNAGDGATQLVGRVPRPGMVTTPATARPNSQERVQRPGTAPSPKTPTPSQPATPGAAR